LTFKTVAIFGATAITRTSIGAIAQRSVLVTLPGLHGGATHKMGRSPTPIVLDVVLLETNDTTMNARMATIQTQIEDGSAGDLVDDNGQTHAECTFESFSPSGPRQIVSGTGTAARMQRGQAVFLKLGV
jgi:hypothetical protein